jgi:hypothetical protein
MTMLPPPGAPHLSMGHSSKVKNGTATVTHAPKYTARMNGTATFTTMVKSKHWRFA